MNHHRRVDIGAGHDFVQHSRRVTAEREKRFDQAANVLGGLAGKLLGQKFAHARILRPPGERGQSIKGVFPQVGVRQCVQQTRNAISALQLGKPLERLTADPRRCVRGQNPLQQVFLMRRSGRRNAIQAAPNVIGQMVPVQLGIAFGSEGPIDDSGR